MLPISSYGLYFVKNVAIIILLLNPIPCFLQEFDPVPPNNVAVNGAFITLHKYASKGPKLERRTCSSLLNCGHFCLKHRKCYSFNYQVSVAHNGLCELSEETIISIEERNKLKKMPGFVFVQIMRTYLVRFQFILMFFSY